MDVSSFCRREVVSIRADASVREAAQAMRQHHIGALVVTDPDEPGRASGIVTDRDLVVGLLAEDFPVEGATVGQLYTRKLVGVPSTATLHEAVQAMQRAGVRRLVVVQPGGSLAGLISADDVFEAVAGELEVLASALRRGIDHESRRTDVVGPGLDIPDAIYLPGHEP